MEDLIAEQLFDTSSEPEFDNVAQLASEICDVPMALISFLYQDQICSKSRVGCDESVALPVQSFCRQTVADVTTTVVEDVSADPRFQNDEFVLAPSGIGSFVGVPLVLASGIVVGCLCVMDHKPRALSNKLLGRLKKLAGLVVALIEARLALLRLLTQERSRLVSEQRLDFALAAADVGDWDMDLRTNVARRSLLHDQCFGYTEPVPVWGYDTFLAHISDEDRARVDECYQRAMAGFGLYDVEFRVVWPDRSMHWLWSKGRFYFDDHGKPNRVSGILVDITKRKMIEESLRNSENRWRFAIEGSGDGLWDWDIPSDVVFYSQCYKEMLGYAGADIGTTSDEWRKRIHPEDAPTVFSAMQPYMDGKPGTATVEFRMLRKDGLWIWILERSMVMEHDAQGKPLRMIGTITDITERKQADLLITQSEQRLELAVGGAGLGLWDWQAPTGELAVNDRWLSMLGLDPAGPMPTIDLWYSLVHVDDLPKLNKLLKDVTMNPTERHFEIEIRVRHQDGHYIWIFDKGHVAERAADGSPLRIVGTHLDISARMRALEALHKHQALLANAEKIGRIGGWDIYIQTLQMTLTGGGYDIYELDGTDSLTVDEGISYFTPESQPIIEQAVQRAIAQGEPFDLELEIITAKGNRRNIHIVAKSDLARGKVTGFLQDITERKRVESALLASNAQLQLLETCVSRLNDIVLITEAEPFDDEPGPRIVFVNDAFERLTGYTREEVIGKTPRILQGKKTQRAELDRIRHALERWQPVRSELINYTKSGEEFWLELDIVPIADSTGWYTHWVAVERDITERRRFEEQLRESQRLESVGQLTGGVAHDFNNLLTVIIGNAELLEQELEGSPAQELAAMTLKAGERGAELTQRLLAFARRQTLDPKVLEVNELLKCMEELLRRTLGEQIETKFTYQTGLWRTMVDPGQLENAVLNLCINARDAMSGGGLLIVSSKNASFDKEGTNSLLGVAPGEYVMISVTDTGVGMDSQTQARVFEPFFTTKEQGKGTGLGLAMIYGFIKQSGGHVSLYSELGQGTTVKLFLPRTDQLPKVSPTEPDFGGGSETILLVEDDEMVSEYVFRLLSEMGYKVIFAENGTKALEIIKARPDIDLLFTDVVMPGMNGKELAAKVAQINPAIKILYTSGYAEDAIVDRGRLDAGVNLLSKPYRRVDLARKLRNLFDG